MHIKRRNDGDSLKVVLKDQQVTSCNACAGVGVEEERSVDDEELIQLTNRH